MAWSPRALRRSTHAGCTEPGETELGGLVRTRGCICGARSYERAPVPDLTEPAATFPSMPLLASALAATGIMLCLWLRQLRTKDATSVDVGWAATIGALAVAFAITSGGSLLSRGLAAVVALSWSGRLSLHILFDRVLRHRGEDARYAALRQHLGPRAAQRFVFVYLLQAALAVAFAMPFLVLANHDATALAPIQIAGVCLFSLGLGLESWSDRHLAAHRKDPTQQGRACRSGPWRYSRHPNYFGEWLVWCGISAIAMPAPHGELALLAPSLMFVLIRFVSGVPWAERQSLKSRGDDYRAYQRETNCFFPWWPRRIDATRGFL